MARSATVEGNVKYGRRDSNHAAVRDALRRIPGCRVFDAADMGQGFPDLVVGFMGVIRLIEVKDGRLSPSKRRLTKDEKRFHSAWEHLPVFVVNDIDEAFGVLGLSTDAPPF